MGAPTTAGPSIERHRAVLVLVAAMVAVLVLAAQSPAFGLVSYRIASSSAPTQAEFDALTVGTFHGQVNIDGTACFWLGGWDDRLVLFWPYGYSAGGFPLAVYDASRKRVADIGRLTWIGGGLSPPDLRSILGFPRSSRIWLVGHIVSQR